MCNIDPGKSVTKFTSNVISDGFKKTGEWSRRIAPFVVDCSHLTRKQTMENISSNMLYKRVSTQVENFAFEGNGSRFANMLMKIENNSFDHLETLIENNPYDAFENTNSGMFELNNPAVSLLLKEFQTNKDTALVPKNVASNSETMMVLTDSIL
ncbi:MAG: hypothetical protein HOG49_09440, partial [Candidatus Scalindua sp.]|nr:hypothetical protein [Candidatus Scalindua sp.]